MNCRNSFVKNTAEATIRTQTCANRRFLHRQADTRSSNVAQDDDPAVFDQYAGDQLTPICSKTIETRT